MSGIKVVDEIPSGSDPRIMAISSMPIGSIALLVGKRYVLDSFLRTGQSGWKHSHGGEGCAEYISREQIEDRARNAIGQVKGSDIDVIIIQAAGASA